MTSSRSRTSKTPSLARRIGLCLALLLAPAPAYAEPSGGAALGEADVIRLARVQSARGRMATATDAVAEARQRSAGVLPNPSVSWSRESVATGPRAGQGSEDTLSASIPIDVAGPRTRRALASSESAWLRAEASISRTDAALEAVLAYYEVLLAERRVAVLSEALANLEEASRVLARREAEGTASGYESARLAVARELGASALAEALGETETAKVRLAGLLGLPRGSLRLSGDLGALSPSQAKALVPSERSLTPEEQQARESLRLAELAQRRAEWAWLPTFELQGGLKRASDVGADSGYGYVVGLSIDVPFFEHGQVERAEAQAQRELALARTSVLTRSREAEARSALVSFQSAISELERFDAETSDQVEVLLAAATSGYREGERTVVELLDAQRARTEVAERRLALIGLAKRAEVRLRAAQGGLK